MKTYAEIDLHSSNNYMIVIGGTRGIEPPPGFADRPNGVEARVAPSAIGPIKTIIRNIRG